MKGLRREKLRFNILPDSNSCKCKTAAQRVAVQRSIRTFMYYLVLRRRLHGGPHCVSKALRLQGANIVVLVLVAVKLLYVNSVLLGQTLQYAGLVKLLTGTEFLYNTGPFELSLELLQGAFNVFALFNLYYDHFVSLDFILLLLYCVIFGARAILLCALNNAFLHTLCEVQNYAFILLRTNFCVDFLQQCEFAEPFAERFRSDCRTNHLDKAAHGLRLFKFLPHAQPAADRVC